ncbi:hypothetical protein [Crocosphaera sp. XPORK-15E]|uniref:hypothetical protein n=1 Tax=Crocosphaera sp. XPORK-15E TaxID=3110247 RepID=UPI002B1F8846|nr:hypothetical protein [Crocosphaera sp. XPORK-15E]MEA5533322.1 hypothetical protein [Crocosphaera sp. XPORK-15E]
MNINLHTFFLLNLSHKIYGILKSIQRKLGLQDAEIDDGSESIIREYGIWFLLFGILLIWVIYQSFSQNKRR